LTGFGSRQPPGRGLQTSYIEF